MSGSAMFHIATITLRSGSMNTGTISQSDSMGALGEHVPRYSKMFQDVVYMFFSLSFVCFVLF